MTGLHKRVAGILWPIMKEVSAKQSGAEDQGETPENIRKIRASLTEKVNKGWDITYADIIREVAFHMTGDKHLEQPLGRASKSFLPFTVLFGTFDKTKNSLAICVHEAGHYIRQQGDLSTFTAETKKIASDDQIKQCLEELNPAQLRFIMTNAVFMPLMAPLFEEPAPEEPQTTPTDETTKSA